jgi:hypothetical protein
MQRFTYLSPKTLPEALERMPACAGRIRPLAGGTDLMVELRKGDEKLSGMEYALDLTGIPELAGISNRNGLVLIARWRRTTPFPIRPSYAPPRHAFAGSLSVGAQQIRNAATIGGNVCNAAVAADTLSPPRRAGRKRDAAKRVRNARAAVDVVYHGGGQNRDSAGRAAHKDHVRPADGWQTAFVKLGRRKRSRSRA